MENLGLPKRIECILQTMLINPSAQSHLLLIGPPGSGKTTSARLFVEALHKCGTLSREKTSFFGRALFLNSSDERGLEAVRSRVYPFIRASFNSLFVTTGPKIIVFDEAETLTDQAQIALRPLLDMRPQEIMIIFLCNSISRINPSIIHKFTIIPFEAPKPTDFQVRIERIIGAERCSLMSGIDIQFRRGDIRFFLLNPNRFQDCAKLWHECMNTHSSQLKLVFEQTLPKWPFSDLTMFFMFIGKLTNTLSLDALHHMLRISDTDFIKQCSPKVRAKLLANWFETHIRIKLEQWPPTV